MVACTLSSPSLLDLYNSIDWSTSKEALSAWGKSSPNLPNNEDSNRLLRLSLLVYALPPDIVGPQPYWTLERNQHARYLLHLAGVWSAVVDWLITRKLIGPTPEDTSTQLSLFSVTEYAPNADSSI